MTVQTMTLITVAIIIGCNMCLGVGYLLGVSIAREERRTNEDRWFRNNQKQKRGDNHGDR